MFDIASQRRSSASEAPTDGPEWRGAEQQVRVADVLHVLRRRAWLVLAVALVTTAAAAYYVSRAPQQYVATAVLRLVDDRRQITQGIETRDPDDGSRPLNPLRTEAELVRNRTLVGGVVDSEALRLWSVTPGFPASLLVDLQVDSAAPADTLLLRFTPTQVAIRSRAGAATAPYGSPVALGGVRFTVRAPPGAASARLVVAPREQTIDGVMKTLWVVPRAETNIIDVSYLHPDPGVAQRFTNRLATSFQAWDTRTAQEQSRRRRVFLEAQLRGADSALAASERALAAFRSGTQVYSSKDQIAAQQSALVAVDVRREDLEANRRTFQQLLDRLQGARAGEAGEDLRALIASPEMSANPVVVQLTQQLNLYQTQRDSLTTGEWKSAPTNPDVVRLNELIASTEGRLASAARSQIAALDARIAALGTLRSRSAAQMQVLPGAESRESELSTQVDESRRLANELHEDYRKAQMAEAAEVGHVEVVELARRPYRPMSQHRGFKLALALVLGLGLGVVVAFVREAADGSVRRREEVESGMRLPVLSVVPRAEVAPAGRFGRARVSALLDRRSGSARAAARGAAAQDEDAGLFAADVPVSEAYRVLRTNLTWSLSGEAAKTLVVTSALPQEGKTTTAANLAAAYAREGRRTLLVDCDLRRPRLHRVFRTSSDPGLVQLLLGHASASAVVRPTPIERLSFLPAGRGKAIAPDLLTTARMEALFALLRERYDLVVLDSPPVLAGADAAVLAALADGVVVVVCAGRTDRDVVEHALGQLRAVGARLVGAVLNDPRGKVGRYGGAYYSYTYASEQS